LSFCPFPVGFFFFVLGFFVFFFLFVCVFFFFFFFFFSLVFFFVFGVFLFFFFFAAEFSVHQRWFPPPRQIGPGYFTSSPGRLPIAKALVAGGLFPPSFRKTSFFSGVVFFTVVGFSLVLQWCGHPGGRSAVHDGLPSTQDGSLILFDHSVSCLDFASDAPPKTLLGYSLDDPPRTFPPGPSLADPQSMGRTAMILLPWKRSRSVAVSANPLASSIARSLSPVVPCSPPTTSNGNRKGFRTAYVLCLFPPSPLYN